METPSSNRRITRSQTTAGAGAAASSKNGKQEVQQHPSRLRKGGGGNPERSALLDISNDSPIVGLAIGCPQAEKTPSSSVVKNRARSSNRTQESGEALLRDQVRTLLQKVKKEAELVNKLSPGHLVLFPALSGLTRSPAQLLAPTPANTPQILSMSCLNQDGVSVEGMSPSASCFYLDDVQPVESASKPEEPLGAQECVINRALLFDDSPGKSELSETSSSTVSLSGLSMTHQGSQSSYLVKYPEDDSSSVWSMQVNVSVNSDNDADAVQEFVGSSYYDQEGEEAEEDPFDELFEGLRNMSVVDPKLRLPEFAGKHTRFIYNSDDEIEQEVQDSNEVVSLSRLVLKGLQVPEGKHLRFQEEEDED